MPPREYQRFTGLIAAIEELEPATLDDRLGLLVLHEWIFDPATIPQMAEWFGVREEDVRRSRDHILDHWDTVAHVWDIDSQHALIRDEQEMRTASEAVTAWTHAQHSRNPCPYVSALPCFRDGSLFAEHIAHRLEYRLETQVR